MADADEAASGRGSRSVRSAVDQRLTPLTFSLLAGVVGLGLGVYQLTRPGVLTGVLGYNLGYDDSVHLGVPTRLVHGSIPYRDFVFVHPPGIAYLLTPVALVGRVIGTADTVAIARILTVLVVAANATLAGLLVRQCGRVASAIAAFAVALWPLTVSVDRNVELEPFLVLFCLLGALVVFGGDDVVKRRTLMIGGVLFGFACTVKVWGVLPVVAALLCCLPQLRQRARPVLIGVLAGGVVPCLPFFLLAPSDFVHDIVTAQLSRNPSLAEVPTPFGDRLLLLSGFGGWGGVTDEAAPAIVLFVVLVALVVVAYGLGFAQRTRVEWFVLVAAIVVNLGMFVSSQLYDHYAYFPAVFLALLLGVSANGSLTLVASRRHRNGRRVPLAGAVGLIALSSVTVVGVAHNTAYARTYLSETSDQSAAITAVVPEGACVLTDYPIDLIVAERFTSSRSDCPPIVDPFGMYLTEDDGNQPHPYPPFRQAFVDKWRGWLERADFVILRIEYSHFLPWPNDQINWFSQHFELVAHYRVVYDRLFLDPRKDIYIYRNIDRASASAAPSDANDLLQRGLDAQAAGRIAEAQKDYQTVLAIDPQNKFAAYNLGLIAQQQQQTEDARGWYERALKIDPSYKPALFNLAILLTPTSPEGAVALYRTLLTLNADDANVHLKLGLLLKQLGRDEEAAAEFSTAVGLDPTLAEQVPG